MRKLLLIIQELIIVNCILVMIAFLSITVQAKGRALDEPMAKEITGIGNYGIENPSKPIIDEAWQGNYVYFGEYDMDNDGKKEPVKYRVLSKCTTDFSGNDSTVKTMLLDCDNVFLIMMPGKQFIFRMWIRTVKQYFRFQRNTGIRNAEPIIMFI